MYGEAMLILAMHGDSLDVNAIQQYCSVAALDVAFQHFGQGGQLVDAGLDHLA